MASKLPPAPKNLKAPTKRWWKAVVSEFDLRPHHLRLLQFAAEAWDRAEQAKEAIRKHGLVFTDKHGQPRARPEVNIERDSRIGFARMLREIGLDLGGSDDSRIPRLPGTE